MAGGAAAELPGAKGNREDGTGGSLPAGPASGVREAATEAGAGLAGTSIFSVKRP
jgi:hypothetical protein